MHCVGAITKALQALDGVSQVTCDLEAKTVTVDHDQVIAPLAKITAEIEELGYDVLNEA